jgi:hypothetical protein
MKTLTHSRNKVAGWDRTVVVDQTMVEERAAAFAKRSIKTSAKPGKNRFSLP